MPEQAKIELLPCICQGDEEIQVTPSLVRFCCCQSNYQCPACGIGAKTLLDSQPEKQAESWNALVRALRAARLFPRAVELLKQAKTSLHDAGYLWGDIDALLAEAQGVADAE